MREVKRKAKGGAVAPVLPGLHPGAIQQEVQRLPVVVHFVAVVHEVEPRADQARRQQQQERPARTQAPHRPLRPAQARGNLLGGLVRLLEQVSTAKQTPQ